MSDCMPKGTKRHGRIKNMVLEMGRNKKETARLGRIKRTHIVLCSHACTIYVCFFVLVIDSNVGWVVPTLVLVFGTITLNLNNTYENLRI